MQEYEVPLQFILNCISWLADLIVHFFLFSSMCKLCYWNTRCWQNGTKDAAHCVSSAATTTKNSDTFIFFSSINPSLSTQCSWGLHLTPFPLLPLQLHPHITLNGKVLLRRLEFHSRSEDGVRPCMQWLMHLREVILCSFYLICLSLYTAIITVTSEHLIIIGSNL